MSNSTLFWAALACAVVAQVAILAAAARKPYAVPADSSVPVPHRAAEVAWTMMPAAMLALVLLLTWNAIRVRAEAPAHHHHHVAPASVSPGHTAGGS